MGGCLEALINKTTGRSLLRLRPQNVHGLLVLVLGLWARVGQAGLFGSSCKHGKDGKFKHDCYHALVSPYNRIGRTCSDANAHQKLGTTREGERERGFREARLEEAYASPRNSRTRQYTTPLDNTLVRPLPSRQSSGRNSRSSNRSGDDMSVAEATEKWGEPEETTRSFSPYGNRRRLQRCSHGIKTYFKCKECDENGNGRTCDVGYLDRKYKNEAYEERVSDYPRKRSGNNDCPHLTSDQRFQWRHLFRGPKGLDGFGKDGCPECSPSSKKYKCGKCDVRSDQSPGSCQFATHHQWEECDAQNGNGRQSPRDPRARYQPSNCNNCNNCTDCFDRDPNLGACEAVARPSLNFDDDFARPSRKKKSKATEQEQKGWLGGWFGRRLAEDNVTLRRLTEDNVNSLTAFCAWALMLLIVVVVYTLTKMGKRSAMQRRLLSKTQVSF